jgi:hypothetical protein
MHIMDDTNTSFADSSPEKPCRRPKWFLVIFLLTDTLFIVGILLWFFWPLGLGHNELAGPPILKASEPPLLKADGKDLKATVISPHLQVTIKPGKNVLWCSTFQLVWNETCRYAGGDIRLKDEPPIVAALNKKIGNEKDVDAASCLVISGLVQDGVVEKIRRELDRKFQGQSDPDLLNRIENKLPPNGWLAYAYLFRELHFEHPFKRLEEPLSFSSVKVTSFGLKKVSYEQGDYLRARQVEIMDYNSNEDFILSLKPTAKNERILLAKIAPADTLLNTIETVRSRIASIAVNDQRKELEEEETIEIPILNFDLLNEYDEFKGKQIVTPGSLQGTPILLALQSIRFRLDEKGAMLKSQAIIPCSVDGDELKPRQFIFDKPFLILLERKGAPQPYFALWVDNPELLVPFK